MYKKIAFLLTLFILLLFSNGRFSLFFITWISAALLLYWVRNYSPVKGFLWAWGLLALAWLFQFQGMVPVPLPFYFIIAFTYTLVGSISYLLDLILNKDRTRFINTLIFPSSWAFIEYLTQFAPYGSWGFTAYSQHTQLVLLQSISLFGMVYITFLIGWFASICNWVWINRMEWVKIKTGLLLFMGIVLLTMAYGSLRLVFLGPNSNTVRIASISAIKKEGQVADAEMQKRFFANQLTDDDIERFDAKAAVINNDLLERSIKEALSGARIIFWGEANASVLKHSEANLFLAASEIAVNHQIYLGVGVGTLNAGREKPLENKLVLFDPKGEKVIDFWKALPVPGPEAAISAVKDKNIQKVVTPYGTVGAVICFDMDFPQLLKQASDVDIMLVPSNDWKAIDPWHTHMSRFRAIEQGFNMIRHTSNGLSVGADYTGRVISEMDHYVDEEKILITQIPTKGTTTLYSIIGDTFPMLCLLLFLYVIFRPSFRRKLSN